jgi:hypothetical protein
MRSLKSSILFLLFKKTSLLTWVMSSSESTEESQPVIKDEQLSCIGQNLKEIPKEWGERYGTSVKRIDLSYNELRFDTNHPRQTDTIFYIHSFEWQFESDRWEKIRKRQRRFERTANVSSFFFLSFLLVFYRSKFDSQLKIWSSIYLINCSSFSDDAVAVLQFFFFFLTYRVVRNVLQ